MLDYGRRRCCSGVYMVDAENFESIVAELKSEEPTSKMRPRCNSASFLSHERRSSAPNNYTASGSIRKQNTCQVPLHSTVPVCDNGLRKESPSKTSDSVNSESPKTESRVNSHCSNRHHGHYQAQQHPRRKDDKTKDNILNNARKHVSTSITYSSVCSCSIPPASPGPNVVTDMPVKWIKNNLSTRILDIRLHSIQAPQHACKSCVKDKAGHFAFRKISVPLSTSIPHIVPSGLSIPQVASSPNLHSLIHYATGQPILLYDFTEESCPLCQTVNSQCQDRRANSRRLPQSNAPSSSTHRSQYVPPSPVTRQGHGSFVSTSSLSSSPPQQPVDFIDLSSKRTSHPQVNLNVPAHPNTDCKTSYSRRAAPGTYEARLCNHPTCTPRPHSGNHCICHEFRCSQCLWSQFFNDSYYCVYYMFPQVPPPSSHPSSVYVDLTEKAFSITIERPFTEEEVKSSLKDSKSGIHSGTPDVTQTKAYSEYESGEQTSTRSWIHRPQSSYLQFKPIPMLHSSAPCGPLICMSLPNSKSLESCKTCLVPQPNFMDYYGSAPPERTWRPLCDPINGAIQFTLMCYNILCEKYASPQIYPYCPAWALNWVFRRAAIMDELRLYSADIICLQEVEMDQYDSHFEKTLKTFGYQGIFSPKSRAHHMNESERRKVDGCAIFWKHERFRLVKDAVIEFSRMAMERYENDCKESPEMLNRVMIRDNIALSAILETKESNQQFMVSTAHIHWDPEYSDVKLIQSIMHISSLYQKIEEHLLEQNGGSGPVNPSSMPLIVCGDFNSLPQSGVVEFLTTGRVAKSHPDFKNLGYVKVLDKLCSRRRQQGRTAALPDPDMLHHDFVLGRAYDYGEGMRYTNYTYDFKGIIDYIFYTKDHFNLLGNLEMISEDWLKKEKVPGCPHPHIASDHFPLLVELELKPPGSERVHGGPSTHGLRK